MFNSSNISLSSIEEFHKYLCDVPFQVNPTRLYTLDDVYDAFDPNDKSSFERCYDTRVYQHMIKHGKHAQEQWEMSARSMHDCKIRKHLQEFLKGYEQKLVVGIMGGHAMKRTDSAYKQSVNVSKCLTEKGYLMISGGGPGAMEATHLGAWMAGRTDAEVDDAIAILSQAPTFKDEGWLNKAFEVMEKYPLEMIAENEPKYKSVSIPTWFYGHEPPCAFSTHIAKFFDNSIREDMILTIAYGGLIYMPGSAGTLQEIFQEAVQDHYLSLGYASPMVFVGRDYWTNQIPVYPFMEHMIRTGNYKNMLLSLVDTTEEIVSAIDDFK